MRVLAKLATNIVTKNAVTAASHSVTDSFTLPPALNSGAVLCTSVCHAPGDLLPLVVWRNKQRSSRAILASFPRNRYAVSMTTARLARYTAAPGQGASFIATNRGSVALIQPLSTRADEWLRDHVTPEATWHSDELVVEMRYFGGLAEAIIEAGFLFERNAFPN